MNAALLVVAILGVDHYGSLVAGKEPPPPVQAPAPPAEAAVPAAVQSRYTRAELTKLAYQHSMGQPLAPDGNRILAATVEPPDQVWQHLKAEHGFTAEQVDGLTLNQALWVHSGAHAGAIRPGKEPQKVLPVIQPRYEMRQFCGPGGCYWQRVRVN